MPDELDPTRILSRIFKVVPRPRALGPLPAAVPKVALGSAPRVMPEPLRAPRDLDQRQDRRPIATSVVLCIFLFSDRITGLGPVGSRVAHPLASNPDPIPRRHPRSAPVARHDQRQLVRRRHAGQRARGRRHGAEVARPRRPPRAIAQPNEPEKRRRLNDLAYALRPGGVRRERALPHRGPDHARGIPSAARPKLSHVPPARRLATVSFGRGAADCTPPEV